MTSQIALTQSEVEALAAKATKGSSLPWGIAEEAAFAARWFHMRGVDILTTLAQHLDRIEGREWDDLVNGKTPLSALCYGPTLGDYLGTETGYNLGPTLDPILLLPFIDAAAEARNVEFAALIDGTEIDQNTHVRDCNQVEIIITTCNYSRSLRTPPLYPETTQKSLENRAFATYVPATEASRAGAGSDLSDND